MKRVNPYLFYSLVLLALFCFGPAQAEDFGKWGKIYSIDEPDAIDVIKAKVARAYADGTVARKQREYIDRNLDAINHPQPLPGITTAQEYSTRLFDPTIVINKDYADPSTGKLIVAAGTRINPLEKLPFQYKLMFLDGRDPRQLKLAKEILVQDARNKVILTAGSYVDLMEQWKLPVYFDQRGTISKRLGITKVPSLVYAKGNRLMIEEGFPH